MDLSALTRSGVTVPVRRDESGKAGPTPWQTRSGSYRRTGHGWYVPAEVDPRSRWQRTVEAAAVLPDGTAVTGWAALDWLGASWFPGQHSDGVTPRPVPVVLSGNRRIRAREGLLVCDEWAEAAELTLADGLPVTRPARSACFEIMHARSLTEAVVATDMAAYSNLTSLQEIEEHAARYLWGRPHTRRIRRAIEYADENSWSPRESAFRMFWATAAGMPRPGCNVPIFSSGGSHLCTPDLLDVENGVVGEYDGRFHLADDTRARDLNRVEMYRDLGLEPVTMVAGDSRDRRSLEHRIVAAYRRARARSRGAARSWTLTPPSWWVDTSTVAARRALDDFQRRLWLRHRAA